MEFTVLYKSCTRDETIAVHKAGCRDIERERRASGATLETLEGATVDDVVNEICADLQSEGMDYQPSDIKVHPCCRR